MRVSGGDRRRDVNVGHGIREDGRRSRILELEVGRHKGVEHDKGRAEDAEVRRAAEARIQGFRVHQEDNMRGRRADAFQDRQDFVQYDPSVPSQHGQGRVCASVRRENHFEMADTCKCEKDPLPDEESLPEHYHLEEVFIPPDEDDGRPEGGIPEGADNAFYIVVPNVMGEGRNPLSITLEDGAVSPRTEDLKVVVQGDSADLAEGEMLDEMTSKGVVIQVPGLSGGNGGSE